MYDDDMFFVANDADRFTIGSTTDGVTTNPQRLAHDLHPERPPHRRQGGQLAAPHRQLQPHHALLRAARPHPRQDLQAPRPTQTTQALTNPHTLRHGRAGAVSSAARSLSQCAKRAGHFRTDPRCASRSRPDSPRGDTTRHATSSRSCFLRVHDDGYRMEGQPGCRRAVTPAWPGTSSISRATGRPEALRSRVGRCESGRCSDVMRRVGRRQMQRSRSPLLDGCWMWISNLPRSRMPFPCVASASSSAGTRRAPPRPSAHGAEGRATRAARPPRPRPRVHGISPRAAERAQWSLPPL